MIRSAVIAKVAGPAAAVAAVLAAVGCGSSQPAPVFHPAGGSGSAAPTTSASAVSTGSGGVVMPPFGKNARIEMTSWVPANADQAKAVIADKSFELAFLYADYTGGKDDSWSGYVTPSLKSALQRSLAEPDVTTQSFIGTIRYFHMSVIPDPNVSGSLDVSGCFDNAQATNTDIKTGKVLPDNTPADQHYYRFTDQLTKNSAGQWQVVSNLPVVYYPRAKECKP